MRDADKIKTKMTIALDGHQLGYLIFGGLIVAGLVFAAGFVLGQRNATPARPQALAEVACLEVLDDAGAASVAAVPTPLPALRYEERLRAPVPPVAPEDPALRLLAEERTDLALPGEEPEPPGIPVAERPSFADDEPIELQPPDPTAPAPAAPTPQAVAAAAPARPAAPAAAPKKAVAEKETRSKKAAEKPEPPGKFTIQVQAFRNRPEADAFADSLRGRGHKPFVQESKVPGKGRWFRVRVGRFAEHTEALAFQKRFEAAEGIDTFVSPL
jgi:cell division septation protein DedD